MQLTKAVVYIDGCLHNWTVPNGATIDGASIPKFLWSILGGPFEGKYRDASVIHDWYCAVRTETSEATNRMFFNAMISSMVAEPEAKMLYYGVCLAGPKWDELTIQNNRLATKGGTARSLATSVATVLKVNNRRKSGESLATLTSNVNLGDLDLEEIGQRAALVRRRLTARTRGDEPAYAECTYTG